MFNPVLRGWINCFASFYNAALYPVLRHVDPVLALGGTEIQETAWTSSTSSAPVGVRCAIPTNAVC
jgi:hypothetical protein